jgi:hypothetical protein
MKLLKRSLAGLLAAAGIAGSTGCGGMSASPSISPLDFLLPGLVGNSLKNTSPDTATTNATAVPSAPVVAVASVR